MQKPKAKEQICEATDTWCGRYPDRYFPSWNCLAGPAVPFKPSCFHIGWSEALAMPRNLAMHSIPQQTLGMAGVEFYVYPIWLATVAGRMTGRYVEIKGADSEGLQE
jgi:hypothetical protein